MPKKPQGFNAVAKVTAAEGRPAVIEYHPLDLPNDKAAAEQAIIKIFSESLSKMASGTAPLDLLEYRQNNEDNLDFQVATPDGIFEMELTEFAPLKALRARYENAPNSYRVGDLADLLFDCIISKDKYGQKGTKKMLLVYTAHFAFLPNLNVLELVRSKLSVVGHQFEKIIFFAPIDQGFGIVEPLFPAAVTRLSAAQRRVLRENVLTNLGPRSMAPTEGGVMFPTVGEAKE